MSDCSTKAMKPKECRTCGTCGRSFTARKVMPQCMCELDELDDSGCMPTHDDNEGTCCRWIAKPAIIEQRCERLAQVAREMLTYIGSFTLLMDYKYNDRDAARENARRFMEFDEQVNECEGAALDCLEEEGDE